MSIVILALFIGPHLASDDSANLAALPPSERTKEVQLSIEIADESAEQARGLSGRAYLPEDSGMLFVFKEEGYPGFWMKDMNFALDFVWMDQNFKVVDLDENIGPETYPKVYKPNEPAKYVLEVNAGFIEQQGIKIADTLALALDQ